MIFMYLTHQVKNDTYLRIFICTANGNTEQSIIDTQLSPHAENLVRLICAFCQNVYVQILMKNRLKSVDANSHEKLYIDKINKQVKTKNIYK